MKIIFLASSYKMYVQLKNYMKGFVIFFILKIINGKVWWFYLYAPVLLQCQHRCAPDFSVLHRWTGAVLKDAGARTPVRTTFHSYTPVCWCGAKKFWCKHTGAWWIFSVAPVLAPVHSKIFPLHRCAAPVWCAILVHTTSLLWMVSILGTEGIFGDWSTTISK